MHSDNTTHRPGNAPEQGTGLSAGSVQAWPVGQGVQLPAPPRLKVPGLQACGALEVLAQEKAAGQGVQTVLLPREYSPTLQASEAVVVVGHMEPLGQSVQRASPCRANDPGAQASGSAVAVRQAWPAGQGWHTVRLVELTVPLGQS
jgi:hypothetical protein